MMIKMMTLNGLAVPPWSKEHTCDRRKRKHPVKEIMSHVKRSWCCRAAESSAAMFWMKMRYDAINLYIEHDVRRRLLLLLWWGRDQQQQQQQQQRNQSHLAISSTIFKSYPPRMEELAKKTARLVTNDKNGMKPTWRDVICGRTHMPISATWPANLFFHHLLQVHQKQYDASQHKKKQFAVIVRDNILVLGGTFLEWDKHMKCWNELEDKRSLQKTTQAFRDTRKSPKRLPLDKLIVKKLQDLQTDDEEGNDNDDNDNESAASHGSSSAGSA
mmetsp:Transcript_8682/g.24967  ORF Transcript_8682/g.24967 Transcript_8682/m.24967 type:complete len:272 (+) Transcript_8682:680-1495(+)